MERHTGRVSLVRGEAVILVVGSLVFNPLSLVLAVTRLPVIQAALGSSKLPFELHALLVFLLVGVVAWRKTRGEKLAG